MAVFNRVYSPLGTQISMLVAEGSLKQDYDADNKIYTPDRRIRPTAIQPVCRITDPSGILENGTVNRYITDIKWYENEISESNLISSTNSKYKIDSTSNTNNRGRIIVYKNVNFDDPVTLIFTATFADMVNGKLRRKAYFVGSLVLASNVAASSPVILKTDYPRGRCFNPIKGLEHLKLSADLFSGETAVPAAYWWYKKNGNSESLITDYTGNNLHELEVPTGDIGKEQHYICKVQDCRQNLTDVRNEYLQGQLDKIAGYPRNLLAKQYLLDLNDEIASGTVTEGEDSDGKYILIPNPDSVYSYTDREKYGDLFGGKISFKENTVYVIRCKGKYVTTEEKKLAGLVFVFVYSDGSKNMYEIGGINTTKEFVAKSAVGKTVSHISCTYFTRESHTYLYDLQITEDYNYNLLEGDTDEVTVDIKDAGTSGDKYKLAMRKIPKLLSAGQKLTVSIGDVVNLRGEATEYTAILYQIKESGNQSVGGELSLSKKTLILTMPSGVDSTLPCVLYLYAGKSGATTGNAVQYKNVQLLEGEYAWNVLGEDVEEVTAGDGSDNQAMSTLIQFDNELIIGGKYTLDIGDIVNLKGEATEYTVFIQQVNGDSQIAVSDFFKVTDTKSVIFTINDKYVSENVVTRLVLYAGVRGETAGNIVQFKNIRLLQGETVLPSMPAYTPHFIPSAPDIEVESEAIQLPDGYRPSVQGKTIDHEFTLVTRLPPYRTSVVTPYGDDSGVISIPSDVKLFPAWIQVDVAGIGTLDNPEKYFSADWGNGLRGMNVLLDADDIGLGIQEVDPDIVEGLDKVRYAVSGVTLPVSQLEDFTEGTRIVVECTLHTLKQTGYTYVVKGGIGLMVAYKTDGYAGIFLYGDGGRKSLNLKIQSTIQRYEVQIGATLEEHQLFLNGEIYTGTFSNKEEATGNSAYIDGNSHISLMEIYSPDNVLLHKWDFEGSTDDERLSDKAETENKINFSKKSEGFELIPV